MYQSFEKPLFDTSVFYYDVNFYRDTAEKIVEVFERNEFLPCGIVCLEKYTNKKFIKYKPEHKKMFVDAYEDYEVVSIILETKDSRKTTNYCCVDFTMNKPDRELIRRLNEINPNRKQNVRWNVLSFYSTYEWIRDKENYAKLINTLYELIPILLPFCIEIDDLSHALKIRHIANEPTFKADHIQQVYWGNYWGGHLMKQVNLEELRKLPVSQLKETENGVFFTLSDSIFDFNSKQCNSLRKKVWQKVIK